MDTIGYIRVGTRLSYDLHYSREFKTEHGRTIIAATDRPIPAFEATRATRTSDYSLTYFQIDLDDDDRGEGVLAV